jgi:uncharacterized SAM-binding protein YcdF (DUF218 family)
MFVFLSKILPPLVYPIGLTSILLVLTLIFNRKERLRKGILVGALLILWIGGNRWVAVSLTRSLEWRYLPPDVTPTAEVIVVLGGGTHSAQYPRSLVELNGAGDRVLYAGWLYHQGAAPNLLLTGGYIEWISQRDSPAHDMAAVLTLLGVPGEAVWLEPESQNTYENALYTRRILEEKGINEIILVTSALHMPRAVALFEHQGFDVIPAPTDFSVTEASWERLWEPSLNSQIFNLLPGIGNLEKTTVVMKEYIGMLVYRWRGWM